ILMRYTLRLLTAQQFQRAGTLICACEQIRKDNLAELGKSPITIGLWIGQAATPNNIADAFSHLDALVVGREDKNPFQVLTCPWCGTKLVVDKQRGNWGYKRGTPKQFLIHCTEKSCAFSKALPILVVDEDIYNTPPTLLFGTVDKFAMLPWKTDVSRIFAMDHGNLSLSPELIIQDELHLISGPLGSVVGLYETAIDALCSAKGVKPKIIASTATIRRAGDQIKAVYARKVSQFPSPGIDAGDSFFAREAGLDELPGRLYVGVMAAGKTMTTTQIRLMSGLLQYTHEMQYPPEIRDKYWTLVGYFNTIRELGKCATFVDDDIKEQVKRIASRRKCHPRLMYQSEELYSMKSAEEIPVILEKMAIPFPDKAVIDVLLASNMISVGVDINRLGLMVVVGQPKTTGEYIQATSRVGRKFPGLILTIFDGARARDRSHYERFTAYHNAFYRYVEPTSVTPFAGPARDRALKAVLVSLIRHWTGLSKDNAAGSFQKNMAGVDAVRDYILDRVAVVMPEELQGTKKDIDEAFDSWQAICNALPELQYAGSDKHLLYTAGRRGRYWPLLKSMRSVDVECNLSVRD
ncbi:MAG: helicase, partial [Firmicutes bacterium]|nr:helicase [Bacillota bacterium]